MLTTFKVRKVHTEKKYITQIRITVLHYTTHSNSSFQKGCCTLLLHYVY